MSVLLFSALTLFACRPDQAPDQEAAPDLTTSLQVLIDDRPEWQYEQLRLYPIVADENFIERNSAAAELLTLEEAIAQPLFRISEKKPYGRFSDRGAVNQLTVQNKSEAVVLMLGGDVVQGGKQDRVVAEDQIIAARSLQDIPVFCVEKGRWSYPETETEVEQPGKVYAFSGYYQVAAGDIRRTLAESKDQTEVWAEVGRITSRHQIQSATHAYAALETADNFTRQRDAYLRFFADKFSELDQMVGIIAVSGDRVLATDIFGHPNLMHRQLQPLLHSYVTDVLTRGAALNIAPEIIEQQLAYAERDIARQAQGTTRFQDALVHYFHPGSNQ